MKVRGKLRSVFHRMWPPRPKPLILMYHRVAEDPVDPWSITVSPACFEEHLQVLCRSRRPLPIARFFRDLMAGTLRPDSVALTFDDGYLDNLIAAKPRLAAADVPATVFLTTGYLNRPGKFWWDELAKLILFGNGPQRFDLQAGGKTVQIDVDDEALSHQDTTPSAIWTKRRPALMAIWEIVRRLDEDERGSVMRALGSIFAVAHQHAAPSRPMTSEEVHELVADSLVTIGAHSVTHPVLSELEPSTCRREITESKRTCEALVGAPVVSFSYPYGDFKAQTREEVRAAGFAFACSTQHGPAVATSDAFALPRIHVHNWDGHAFERALHSASVFVV
jgi:peptidoglycan/xylan/chitin deacetylase (PgdA/CDA1 family)